ncbi:MAG: Glutathione-regulated potassium-efflux system protein KefC [Chroococcopsis gigantea SAG 12.99]|nr:Glutathione-regulated potassium-efflux system protein KefC [Chroococcopsis gigantea SAG 12.99]
MKPRIIVCGLGLTGYKIFNLLKRQGADVIGISDRAIASEYGQDIVVGDPQSPETLIRAGLKAAQTLVLAADNDGLNLAILTQARLINPGIHIINRLFNQTLGEKLSQTLPNHVSLSVSAIASPIFCFAAMGNKAIGQLHLYNQTWPIQEVIINEEHPWCNVPLSDLWDSSDRMLIYYLCGREEIDLVSAVTSGRCLQPGDHLIVGTQPGSRKARKLGLQKFIKNWVNFYPYKQYILPVALVCLLIAFMIGGTTLTYVSANYKISVIDALYFSVGMITGGGGNERIIEQSSDGVKIFTVIMMIIGASVIGICYALLNDFILGSRLKQFWDAARVPTRNHYIVCGLAGIGMQIVRQLHNQGCEVVIIESDPNHRFLHTARSMGIPVIVEDGRLPETLKAANIQGAQAMLIVTSDDMTNVEIGLTAKAITPKITLIVRTSKPQFGRSFQEVFDFDAVLCPSELATYSFASAALGGKILGNGMTDDLLWVAIATLITPNHPFCDKHLKEAAIDCDFVPLYLERHGRTIHSWQLLEVKLQSHDVLYITIPATKLEKLWRDSPTALEFKLSNLEKN